MHLILVYDVGVERVTKIRKICSQYLFRVQNSVFEGEISTANFIELSNKLKEASKSEDSFILYLFNNLNKKYYSRIIIGADKGISNII